MVSLVDAVLRGTRSRRRGSASSAASAGGVSAASGEHDECVRQGTGERVGSSSKWGRWQRRKSEVSFPPELGPGGTQHSPRSLWRTGEDQELLLPRAPQGASETPQRRASVTGMGSGVGGGRRGAFAAGASVLHVKAVAGALRCGRDDGEEEEEEDDEEAAGLPSDPWLLRAGVVVMAHLDDPEALYYTVRLDDGSEIQTEEGRLSLAGGPEAEALRRAQVFFRDASYAERAARHALDRARRGIVDPDEDVAFDDSELPAVRVVVRARETLAGWARLAPPPPRPLRQPQPQPQPQQQQQQQQQLAAETARRSYVAQALERLSKCDTALEAALTRLSDPKASPALQRVQSSASTNPFDELDDADRACNAAAAALAALNELPPRTPGRFFPEEEPDEVTFAPRVPPPPVINVFDDLGGSWEEDADEQSEACSDASGSFLSLTSSSGGASKASSFMSRPMSRDSWASLQRPSSAEELLGHAAPSPYAPLRAAGVPGAPERPHRAAPGTALGSRRPAPLALAGLGASIVDDINIWLDGQHEEDAIL